MTEKPNVFFVYGTLKRGQERAAMWPRPAVRIEPATIRGLLRDLGPYPALVNGTDLVGGELWFLNEADLEITIRTLDAIECCNQGGVDLYERHVRSCVSAGGQTYAAFVYLYGQPEQIAHHRRVPPDPDGICRWWAGPRHEA